MDGYMGQAKKKVFARKESVKEHIMELQHVRSTDFFFFFFSLSHKKEGDFY